MVCYVPRITTIAGVGAVVYVLLHHVIGRILHIAGLVLEVTLITCFAAAAAALLAWTVRSVQRRRAAAGACSTCRFRCQQPMTPQPVPLRVAGAGPRPAPWPGTPARPRPEPRPEPGASTRPEPWPGTAAGSRPERRPLVLR